MIRYKKPNVKAINRLAVYNYIKDSQGQTTSKPEISKALKLSDPTILKIVSFLLSKDIVKEIGEAETTSVGRKPSLIQLNPMAGYSIGFSYDGIQLFYSCVDLNGVAFIRNTIQKKLSLSELIEVYIPSLIDNLTLDKGKCLGVGIALPATINTKQKLIDKPNPSIVINNQGDIGTSIDNLEKVLHCPVIIENDVNAAAYSLLSFGSLYAPQTDFVYLMLGEGVGAGIYIDGKLRKGHNYSAGEIAYMFPDLHIEGNLNNYEKLLSISSLKQTFNIDLYNSDTQLFNNPILVGYYGRILAQLIHNIGTLLDIDHFILGGYTVECLGKALINHISSLSRELNLRPVTLGIAEDLYDISTGMGMMVTDSQMQSFLSMRDQP